MIMKNRWGSRSVQKSDWQKFKTACMFSDIKLLQKTKRILELGVTLYDIKMGQMDLRGLGVMPKKFRAARDIVKRVITMKLEKNKILGDECRVEDARRSESERYVTREMALDAGDPGIEGMYY